MEKSPCIECGSAPVNHSSEWWSNWFEHWANKYSLPLEQIRQVIQPAISILPWNLLALKTLRASSVVGLAEAMGALFSNDNSRTKALWDSAQPRGIRIERIKLLGRQTEISIATLAGKSRVYMSMPRPDIPPSNAYFWMDNKSKMQKYFTKAGMPVPKTYECRNVAQALSAFGAIGGRAIVKPTYGSRSRHTTVGIANEEGLVRAADIALQISPWIIVQEELPGMVHRMLWVGGKVAAVMRREPAYVVGDGISTIRQLVEQENKNPLRQGPIFHHLPQDSEAERELRNKNLGWESVIQPGETIVLNPKVSRGNGAVNVDVTAETHPANMELFKKIGSFLDDPLVGVDFIIRDITQPWQGQLPCGVIECNSLPYVDLHSYPFAGPARDAAGELWDIVFIQASTQN